MDDAASPSDLEWRDGVPLHDDSGDPEQALWLRWEKPDDGSKMASTTRCLEAHRQDVHGDLHAFCWDKAGARCTATLTAWRLGRLLQDGRRPAPPLPAGVLRNAQGSSRLLSRRVPRDSHVRLRRPDRRRGAPRMDRRPPPDSKTAPTSAGVSSATASSRANTTRRAATRSRRR